MSKIKPPTITSEMKAAAKSVEDFAATSSMRALVDQIRTFGESKTFTTLRSEPREESQKPIKKKPWRPIGTSYEIADRPSLDEMHALIIEATLSEAASHVWERARGAGTSDSKIRRLVSRYNERYPAKSRSGKFIKLPAQYRRAGFEWRTVMQIPSTLQPIWRPTTTGGAVHRIPQYTFLIFRRKDTGRWGIMYRGAWRGVKMVYYSVDFNTPEKALSVAENYRENWASKAA